MSAAYGFGTSKRLSPGVTKETAFVPGPGSYKADLDMKRKNPSWVMGTQKRVEPGCENKVLLQIPGPTAYNLPTKLVEGPQISLSPRLQIEESKFQRIVPGPGQYTPSVQKRANFSFSFGLKTPSQNNKYIVSVPGPGQYELDRDTAFSTRGASLDKGHKIAPLNKTQKIVPGPGNYDSGNDSLISRNAAPKYGFGTSDRRAQTAHSGGGSKEGSPTLESIQTPGPGAYQIKGIVGNDGPMKSLSYRYQLDPKAKEEKLKPGPGQYAPTHQMVSRASPNYRIGTSTREHFYLKDKYKHGLPPPNNYDPQFERIKRASPSTGLGYGAREFLNRTFNFPGPGNYQTPTKIGNDGPKYIMGLKLHDNISVKRAQELPSPDNYNPNFSVTREKQSVFSVGKSKRISLARKEDIPGPGAYHTKENLTNSSPRYGFGSSSQRPDHKAKTQVPGPGHYRIKSSIADVPNYLIPNQPDEFKFI